MTPPGTVLLHGNRASHLLRLFSESVRFLYNMKKFSIKFHFVRILGKTHSQAHANRLFFRFRAVFTLSWGVGRLVAARPSERNPSPGRKTHNLKSKLGHFSQYDDWSTVPHSRALKGASQHVWCTPLGMVVVHGNRLRTVKSCFQKL